MTKVVMLGISGLDADLLRVYGPSLPELRRLLLNSPFLEMRSSFPPEPLPAWASVYTGLHPANHGLLSGNDVSCVYPISWHEHLTTGAHYSYHSHNYAPQSRDASRLETFWSAASHAGKRVRVLNPLLAMPIEKVNGVVQTLPLNGAEAKRTNMTGAPSTRQLENWCGELQALALQQAALALDLFHREPWDLFFVQLDTLDTAQHFLWRYSDPGDPTYPGRNRSSGRVLEFYRLFDEITGRFRRSLPADSVLIVVSGHGHGRRCVHRLHINEWLRSQGLLVAQERLQDVLPRLVRHLPGRRTARRSLASIDGLASAAQLVDLAGTSPFGGIALNREALARRGESYQHTRAMLLQKLLQLRIKGYSVVKWASTREELHAGAFASRYPDIVFELRSDYGVACDLFVPLVTPDGAHRLMSGGHTSQGVLLMEHIPASFDIREGIQEPTVMDVAPTVLQLLGLPPGRHDGASLLLPRQVTQLI